MHDKDQQHEHDGGEEGKAEEKVSPRRGLDLGGDDEITSPSEPPIIIQGGGGAVGE